MTFSRPQRRAMKRNAAAIALVLADGCQEIQAGGLLPIDAPLARKALARAFKAMIEAGCKPVALPVSEAEAQAFPQYGNDRGAGWVTWLAVGLDPDNRGAYALQSATSPDRAHAHDAAKERALLRLRELTRVSGFTTPAHPV